MDHSGSLYITIFGSGAAMSDTKYCGECKHIERNMRTAFLKLINEWPQGDLPAPEELSQLFALEANLARSSELWQQSDCGAAYHKWMEHRIATGHVPVLPSAFN
jgi:hypothetical protein